jgi:hypothetical protein
MVISHYCLVRVSACQHLESSCFIAKHIVKKFLQQNADPKLKPGMGTAIWRVVDPHCIFQTCMINIDRKI